MSRTLTPNKALIRRVVDERVDGAQRALAGAVEAVGRDDVDLVVAQQPHGAGQLVHVERQVGVGVEHEVAGGRREAGLHRAAELAVALVVDDADVGIGGGHRVGDLGGAVGRLVVDDDQLVVGDVARLDEVLAGRACRIAGRARCSPPRSTSGRRPTASGTSHARAMAPSGGEGSRTSGACGRRRARPVGSSTYVADRTGGGGRARPGSCDQRAHRGRAS